ncbi:MAG: DNA-protecting protein DprA [Candidatus Niyogibacteria bacterium]|nr:DNA-protecting protein DprA [Candidatus Niyogibacteria bacterium]
MATQPKEKYKTITLDEKSYPALLREIPDPPETLYMLGNFHDWHKPAIAIVGTRKATSYGLRAARALGCELAAAGITVVSGLALGIDAEAHRGALEANGNTVAVLGSGINMIYPATNRPLAEKIIEQGGAVISEFSPDLPPEKWTFPQRNRIIAGLSNVTLVIEAPEKSGALITAYLALEYNREVAALPGEITSLNSQGTNKLIKLGAAIIRSADDVLELLGLNAPNPKTLFDKLDKIENVILQCLNKPQNKDEMLDLTQLPADILNQKLSSLELKGAIKNNGGLYEISNS